jgi:NitT/TauT family transport system substrate-binding protein
MNSARHEAESRFTRRRFLRAASALTAASAIPESVLAESKPETTKIRIASGPFICYAPQYLAEELLRLEGFTEIEYVPLPYGYSYTKIVAEGGADLALFGPPAAVAAIDSGMPIVMMAGIHGGCWELFGNDRVRAVRDLKGRTIAVINMSTVDQLFVASILSYVGVDPSRDVNWLPAQKLSEAMRLFVENKVDAFLAFPPQPQELRARKVGNVLINTTLDRPWSQYFCCMAGAPRSFIEKNPVATKRALRALLKAADACAADPERSARYLAAKGYEPRYEIGLEVLKSLPFDRWRFDNPEDSLRFYALRLHEAGIIKMPPQKVIAQGSDWRFLNELKAEMKA